MKFGIINPAQKKQKKSRMYSFRIETGLEINSDAPSFSLNGRYIFFKQLLPADNRSSSEDAVKVDVWSYKDEVLQSTQLAVRFLAEKS